MAEKSIEEKIKLLKHVSIFSNLQKKELELLSLYSDIYYFKEGEDIFAEDTYADEIYIIKAGNVIISRKDESGKDVALAHYIANESFGELDLFNNQPRTAKAFAENDANILIFPKKGVAFKDLLSRHPKIFARILHEFMILIASRIRSTNKLISERTPWIEDLKMILYKDKLTGLYNNTYLDEEFPRLLPELGEVVSFLYIKPDNFKDINDNFGHDVGDKALKFLADTISSKLNKFTIVRYRGNESAAILPNIPKKEAMIIAEKLKKDIYETNIREITNDTDFYITVSIGIAAYPIDAKSAEKLIKKAYDKMMVGRNNGGNKVNMV